MMIRIKRADKLTNFTTVPNTAIRGKILSLKTLGLLTYLLSHEDGFQLNRQTITNAFPKDGDTKVRSALQELEECGYLRRYQVREGEGTFTKALWEISAFGDLNSIQEEMPLQFDSAEVVPDNMKLFPGKRPSESKAVPAATAREFLAVVIKEWHEMIQAARPVDVFKVQCQEPKITESRLRSIRARMQDKNWMESWREAIARVAKIPGLHGRVESNGRTFTADIDFFLRPDSVTKIVEGKYDTWFPRTKTQPAESAKKAYTGGI